MRNTRHYTRVRRQTIRLIMSCNVFIISSLPFPSLAKLSNLTSQPYFRFRAVRNLKIDDSFRDSSQVKHLSNVPCSGLLFIDTRKSGALACFPWEKTSLCYNHARLYLHWKTSEPRNRRSQTDVNMNKF